MSNETRDSGRTVSSNARVTCHFIWPLSNSATPDEMNTSYGPRIDADRWDFHDGIDLPARVGTLVHATADGAVGRRMKGSVQRMSFSRSVIHRTDSMTYFLSICISTASQMVCSQAHRCIRVT